MNYGISQDSEVATVCANYVIVDGWSMKIYVTRSWTAACMSKAV